MVHHIVLWNFKEELSEAEREEAAKEIKYRLEKVAETVEGVVSLEVVIHRLDSSNREIALISKFESEDALKAYQVSPAHVEAGVYVRSVTCNRSCLDYSDDK